MSTSDWGSGRALGALLTGLYHGVPESTGGLVLYGQQGRIVHIGAQSTGAWYCTHGGCRVIFVYFRKDLAPNSAKFVYFSRIIVCLEKRGTNQNCPHPREEAGRIVHVHMKKQRGTARGARVKTAP